MQGCRTPPVDSIFEAASPESVSPRERIAQLERTVDAQQQRLQSLESTVQQQAQTLANLERLFAGSAGMTPPRGTTSPPPLVEAAEAKDLTDSMRQLTAVLEQRLRASESGGCGAVSMAQGRVSSAPAQPASRTPHDAGLRSPAAHCSSKPAALPDGRRVDEPFQSLSSYRESGNS